MQRESGIVPEALKKRPKVKQEDLVYLKMFSELNGSRQVGDAIGHIYVGQFRHWCDLWHITDLEETERFSKYLKRLDDTFVTFSLERRKAELDRAKNSK